MSTGRGSTRLGTAELTEGGAEEGVGTSVGVEKEAGRAHVTDESKRGIKGTLEENEEGVESNSDEIGMEEGTVTEEEGRIRPE